MCTKLHEQECPYNMVKNYNQLICSLVRCLYIHNLLLVPLLKLYFTENVMTRKISHNIYLYDKTPVLNHHVYDPIINKINSV
jgi:hypothetical protein